MRGKKNQKQHHSINCWKQDPPMDAKICGQKFKLKQDVHIVSMYFSPNINYKVENGTSTGEKPGLHHLN